MMPLVQWFGHTWVAQAIHNSSWLFPFIEIFHLVSLGLLGGTVILVDLRFFGLVMKDKTVRELAGDVRPWKLLALSVMLVSGFFLFISEAAKMYTNEAFRYKMLFLLLALVFTFTVHRRFTAGETYSALSGKAVALISMGLWTCVGLAGRAIGFV